MKIVRLSAFLNYGGIESKMVKLAHVQDSNEWIFTALGKGGDAENRIKRQNKQCDCLNLEVNIPNIKTIIQFTKYLKQLKPDVLHASGAEANFYGVICGKLAGIPKIICEEIGDFNHSSKAQKVFSFLFGQADYVLGESDFVVNKLKSVYSLNDIKAKVVPNFGLFNYDFSTIKKQNQSDTFKILMVSRIEVVKNIEGAINAINSLKNSGYNVHLDILGSGTLENDLKNLVQQLNLENHVTFLGFRPDPYPFLINSDLYLLNSFSEGFSNSLIEAMYSGTPSISTNTGAATELLFEDKTGFIVEPDNTEALVSKLKKILSLPKENLKQIGQNGQEYITNNYSLHSHVNTLITLYQ